MSPAALPALAALACLPVASGADPLKSPECGRSLAALQAARSAPGQADVQAARRQATQACLGGTGEPRRPSPTARPPLVVPPPVIEAPTHRPAVPAPVPVPPAPPVAVERPPVVTSCDMTGCWTSDGIRLNRSGPVLIGPGGACTTTGNAVRCP